jgi:hypothetical protein
LLRRRGDLHGAGAQIDGGLGVVGGGGDT